MSLRNRLTVMTAGAVAVAVVCVASASWLLVHAKLYQQFDAQLHSYAQLAATAKTPADALATLRETDRRNDGSPDHSSGLTVQFLDPDGDATGPGAGALPGVPVTAQARQVALGHLPDETETIQIGHDRYHVWTVHTATGAAQVARDAEGIEDTLAELGLLHALVGLIGVVGAAVVGWAVARAALRPVDVLTAGAERVARTQDLTAEIPVKGKGEIARLADAFNSMLSALAESRAAQRRLVEDAGHELRTPLTSLRNNVELLIHESTQTDPAKVLSTVDKARLLTDLDLQTIELTTLIGELVELSKEDTAPEPLELLHLPDIVGSAVERVRPRAPTMRFETALADAEVLGRPVSLERAVLNLLDNAAKWGPDNGTVQVAVRTNGNLATITVTDEGPGIPDEDLPHVFERFHRADSARSLPGSGLGLAIVEQVAKLHGGSVLAARADSGGAEVSMTLRLANRADSSGFLTKTGGTFM
jgi:two-component system, OmpR family, sensor histidine kinase MprB